MMLNEPSISIFGYNQIINEALADLFPNTPKTNTYLINNDRQFKFEHLEIIRSSNIIFLELSDVIDTNLNIIPKLIQINPDLIIIGLNEYTQQSYSRRILELGAKGYIPIHCFPIEFKTAIEMVNNGGIFESSFIQKYVA